MVSNDCKAKAPSMQNFLNVSNLIFVTATLCL